MKLYFFIQISSVILSVCASFHVTKKESLSSNEDLSHLKVQRDLQTVSGTVTMGSSYYSKSVSASAAYTISRSGANDWIALYPANETNLNNYISWAWVSCCTSGSWSFTAPIATGTYQVYLVTKSPYTLIATSSAFEVVESPTSIPSPKPSMLPTPVLSLKPSFGPTLSMAPTVPSTVSTDKAVYAYSDTSVTITYARSTVRSNDWVGIYSSGETNLNNYGRWVYRKM